GYLSKSNSDVPQCMAEFTAVDSAELDEYRPLGTRDVYGTLGLITVNNEIFLCVVSSAVQVAEVRPGETVQKIKSVEFRMFNNIILPVIALLIPMIRLLK